MKRALLPTATRRTSAAPSLESRSQSHTRRERVILARRLAQEYRVGRSRNASTRKISEEAGAPKDPHTPVLLSEVLQLFQGKGQSKILADLTFGGGGHTKALLNQEKWKRVYCVDRDASVFSLSESFFSTPHPQQTEIIKIHSRFSKLWSISSPTNSLIKEKVDAIIMDLGVSSMQLDNPSRGFSFRSEAKGDLDMRMDQSGGTSAYNVVNTYTQKQLKSIIWKYGEEKKAALIAEGIIKWREENGPITTTEELATIVRKFFPTFAPGKNNSKPIDAATRTFQALRIHINDEVDELISALFTAEHLLKENGILAVISFHSLEDAIVKHHFKYASSHQGGQTLHLPIKKSIRPSEEEIRANPRSRSARMRVAQRTQNPCTFNNLDQFFQLFTNANLR